VKDNIENAALWFWLDDVRRREGTRRDYIFFEETNGTLVKCLSLPKGDRM
jgi:hypothetical protein